MLISSFVRTNSSRSSVAFWSFEAQRGDNVVVVVVTVGKQRVAHGRVVRNVCGTPRWKEMRTTLNDVELCVLFFSNTAPLAGSAVCVV